MTREPLSLRACYRLLMAESFILGVVAGFFLSRAL